MKNEIKTSHGWRQGPTVSAQTINIRLISPSIYLLFLKVFISNDAPVCGCGHACKSQKRAPDALEVEMQVVVSCPVRVLGTELKAPAGAAGVLKCCVLFYKPQFPFSMPPIECQAKHN